MTVPDGMNVNQDGYLRFHRPSELRDCYAHRVWADRQMRASYGRGLRDDEVVHHVCENKLCWPPSDFHLCIMDFALHAAFEAGTTPHRRHWARRTDVVRSERRKSSAR